jgi:hypothetical protein
MDLSPESLGMTPKQERVAVLKAWAQECGLSEKEAARAMLRFGIEEFNRGVAGLRSASKKLAESMRALHTVLTAEPDVQVLRKLGIAPVPRWPDTVASPVRVSSARSTSRTAGRLRRAG